MPPSNLDPPTSIPDFVGIVKDGMKYAEGQAAKLKEFIAWCGRERARMIDLIDELRAKLEADGDDAAKLTEAEKYLDQFQLVMLTMSGNLRGKVQMTASLRETCDMVVLGCCQNIAGIAEANLAVASGLGADVVGPVQATATLAKTLAKDFFEPARNAAEKAEDALPKVIAEVEKVCWPRGSDVPSIIADILRFKSELVALTVTSENTPYVSCMTAIQEFMQGAKPIVELFDV